jgi:hypothetical protein
MCTGSKIFNKRPLKENEPREPTMEGLRVGLNEICAEFEDQVEIQRLVEKVERKFAQNLQEQVGDGGW